VAEAIGIEDLLAGPIVRRVEPTLASVWIALRKPAQVRLDVYRGLGAPGRDTDLVPAKARADHTIAIGAQLHVALAVFEPLEPERLDWGHAYSYDVKLFGEGGPWIGLDELDQLRDHQFINAAGVRHQLLALGYEPGWLPSFVLPPPTPLQLRIVHGSCRSSTEAGRDAMPVVDDLIRSTLASTTERPHMLWLTGDQIYADSIGAEHVRSLTKTGSRLLSGDDRVTDHVNIGLDPADPSSTFRFPIDRVHFPPGRRTHLMRNVAGFSGSDMDAHLIGFGEYAALYLSAWSNATWPELEPLLAERWPRVEEFRTAYIALRDALEAAPESIEKPDDYDKARDYYEAWRLLPEDALAIDLTLEESDLWSLWNEQITTTEGWTGYWRKLANPKYQGSPWVVVPTLQAPTTPGARELAKALTPAWFAGHHFSNVKIDKDGDVAGDAARVELHRMKAFYDVLPRARRALANIATYMVFDDHEVTDDWNITAGWVTKTRSNELARTVMRNALAAFAVFQGWGNDPRAYGNPSTVQGKVLAEIQKLYLDETGAVIEDGPDAQATARLVELFDIRPLDAPPLDERMAWHFRYDGSGFEILALDTRTRRSYEPAADPTIGQPFTNDANAALITDEAMREQIPADPAPGVGPDGICFVIAAAPFLGFPPVESMFQPILNWADMGPSKEKREAQFTALRSWNRYGRIDKDPEPWGFVPRLFEATLDRLSSRARVVFLSGDVHYSCTLAMSYWKQQSGQLTTTRVVQCTSSPLRKQRTESDVEYFSMDLAQQIVGALSDPVERFGWHKGPPGSDPIAPSGNDGFNSRVRYLLQIDPILIAPQALPATTQMVRAADWSWRMRLVIDERVDDARLSELAPPPLLPTSAGLTEAMHSVADRLIWQVERIPARRWIWWTNVCVVDFSPGPEPQLRHSIYCYDLADQLAFAQPFVIGRTPLDVPASERPPAIGGGP